MKKLLTFSFIWCSAICFCQETELITNKKGTPILPTAGNFAIGLDAWPFLNYIGNLFNSNTFNSAPFLSSAGGAALQGKYLVRNNKAYRFGVALNTDVSSRKNGVEDITNTSGVPRFVEDKKTISNTLINLSAGVEKRRGPGQLQGIYGFEGSIGLNLTNEKFEYGNALSVTNNAVPTTIWSGINPAFTATTNNRNIEIKGGTSFSIAARGFAGFEYFFAPKFSIGGELGYALRFNTAPTGETKSERFFNNAASVSTLPTNNQAGGFRIGTQPTGSIFIFVYL
jgi:hypothetical protein